MSKSKRSVDASIPFSQPQPSPTTRQETDYELADPLLLATSNCSLEKFTEESSAFMKILNVSDLERDELNCKENWNYLPVEKFSDSVTAVENSRIVPPNFMPSEDSLFQELKPSNYESIQLTTLNNSLSSLRAERETERVIPAQKKSNSVVSKTIGETDFDIPSIHDISLALRGCDNNAKPIILMEEILRAGGGKACLTFAANEDQKSLLDNSSITYEDYLIFSSVDIHAVEIRAVHLLNITNQGSIRYFLKLEGNNAFKLHENYPLDENNIPSVIISDSAHELFIEFNPSVLGPAYATLIVYTHENNEKKVKICGVGGKSNLVTLNIPFNMNDTEQCLFLDNDLTAEFFLKNIGTAPAYYYLHFGELEYYYNYESPFGIVKHGKQKSIKFSVIQERSVLINLLAFFKNENVAQVGKLILYYGDESSRQRLKRLWPFYSDLRLTKNVCRTFPHALLDYSEISFNLEAMFDNLDSIPLLIYEAVHCIEISLKTSKNSVLSTLAKVRISKR